MDKSNADVGALQLACRFALPPNSLGYCGRDSAPEKFKKCIIEGGCDGIEEELSKFIVLNPYLKTLGEVLRLPKFSYEVVEAYCLGNDLLKKVEAEHYELLLENFSEQGVPEWLIDELKESVPKKFIPTHLFQVLHVGVGRASGSVEFNLETINNCMFRWGSVMGVGDGEVKVMLNSLEEVDGGYKSVQLEETHPFSEELDPGIKAGNVVAVHWNQVIKMLSKDEVEKLEFWTSEIIQTL
jgi:hypothetical protein